MDIYKIMKTATIHEGGIWRAEIVLKDFNIKSEIGIEGNVKGPFPAYLETGQHVLDHLTKYYQEGLKWLRSFIPDTEESPYGLCFIDIIDFTLGNNSVKFPHENGFIITYDRAFHNGADDFEFHVKFLDYHGFVPVAIEFRHA